MAAFEIPELILTILQEVKEDRLLLSRCLRISKVWRETIIENAELFLAADVYAYCQAAVVPAYCSGASNFEFSIPSIDAQLLIITGGLLVNRDFNGIKLSFVSLRAAELWFRSARRYADKIKHLRPSMLTKLVNQPYRGKLMPPVVRHKTGQLFFWANESFMYGQPTIEEFTLEVRKALQTTDPVVLINARTVKLIGFDGRDRLWFRYANQSTVHAIGATERVTVKPRSSVEAGLTLATERTGHFHVKGDGYTLFEQLAALDKQGRFFFGDSFGVHVIHPDALEHFEYHSIYKINYDLNKVSNSPNFSPIIQMTTDITGKVFVWSASGSYNDRTIGYWCYDGNKWQNVAEVPAIRDMFVRVYNKTRQIWISTGNQMSVLEEPVDNTEVPKLVTLKDAEFKFNDAGTIFAKSADNSCAVLCFAQRSVLLDSTSEQQIPTTLPSNLHNLLKSIRKDSLKEKTNNSIKDGVIYFSDEKMIVGASLDGKTIEPYHCTETTNTFNLGVMHVGSKTMKLSRKTVPLVYLRDGNVLDTSIKYVNREGIPSMKAINESTPSYPSPSGGVYLTRSYWDGLDFPQPSNLNASAFDALIYGKDGTFIIGHAQTGYTLHYRGVTLQAADMCSLADKYYDKLVEVLPFPPIPSYADSHNIIHDGLGNLWCLDYKQAGVRTREKLFLVDTTVHKSKEHDWVSMYTIAALGNGTAVVLSIYYKSMLLRVENGSLVVEDTPVVIPVERIPAGAGSFKLNVFYDKSGEVYIPSDSKTYACKSGRVLQGELYVIDRHGGKWFNGRNTITYMTGDNTYSLSVQTRLAVSEDYALDHAVWVETQSGLARIHFTGKELQIVEEIKMALDAWGLCTAKAARNVMWVKATGRTTSGTVCLVLDEKQMQ